VFTPPTFDDEEVAEHANLETHFIDSSGALAWDMFKQAADDPFVDWSFAGTTEEEFATLMAIFTAENQEVYIADYEHLGVYACRILVPGMSDIYPVEDLWLANNSMGAHLRDTLLALPERAWEKEDYLNLLPNWTTKATTTLPACASCWAWQQAKITAGTPCVSVS